MTTFTPPLLFTILLLTILSTTVFPTPTHAFASCKKPFPIFTNIPATPYRCDGDAGGSEIAIGPNTVEHRVICCGSNPGLGIRLFVFRSKKGVIRMNKSYVEVDHDHGAPERYTYRDSTDSFKYYYSRLVNIIKGFEVGDCPIDSKGQKFPVLAQTRASLQALAGVFKVDDCE